ncbi:hypothetical protein [Epiphyas postvittana nucleopolyhedrovirus]|uniref:Uncharacterized protein n=1 Tax=Epiphyas postvittana nucleopolyhedrovirus TaxID=70600 RepID=Q91GP5_NPVEP|nr:hypothetical protein [Epiphyas postvittana nucleopolyhedrovirus]AAK85566.1 unknown [Epiphyas postvittana nucleopolyhedrovirus]
MQFELREIYDNYLQRATAPIMCGTCSETMNVSQYPEHLTTVHKKCPLQLSCVRCDDQSSWGQFSASGLMFEHMYFCLQNYVQNGV